MWFSGTPVHGSDAKVSAKQRKHVNNARKGLSSDDKQNVEEWETN